jgi:hypothetical protein
MWRMHDGQDMPWTSRMVARWVVIGCSWFRPSRGLVRMTPGGARHYGPRRRAAV